MNIKELLRKIKRLYLRQDIELHKKLSLYLYNKYKVEDENRNRINRLKDRYYGKRIFIICNGPSLKPEDLEMLSENNEISFASNRIRYILNKTKWTPTFYTLMDERGQYMRFDDMQAVSAEYHFYRKDSYYTTRNITAQKVYFNVNGDRALLDKPSFSTELDKEVHAIGTITFAMLEYAVWMGFKEIYIIGCDNRYAKELQKDGTFKAYDVQPHFYGFNGGSGNGSTWEMNIAYECARKFADEHGIKIFNATRGGYLESFERVDFDSLFPKK